MKPTIAIALAAYSPDPVYFEAQLASIADQTDTDWVCIITFDSPGSSQTFTEKTRSILSDSRFEVLENPTRLGHKRNFEKAARIAAGKSPWAIAFCDQDDVWRPNKLERLRAELMKKPPLSMVHSDAELIGPSDELLAPSAWKQDRRGIGNTSLNDILIRNVVSGCSLLIHADLVRLFSEIPDAFKYHDHWFATVASLHGGIHAIPEPLYGYRQHDGNVVGGKKFEGLLASSKYRGLRSAALRTTTLHRLTRLRAEALTTRIPRLPVSTRLMLISNCDFGFAYFLRAIPAILEGDLPLFRACILRGMGKMLSIFGVGRSIPLTDDT